MKTWFILTERILLEFTESGCPIFRATTPLSRGQLKSEGHGKLSIHYAVDLETDETFFSHNFLCKSAESLRGSRRDIGRVRIPSRENGTTRCDGTIKFLTHAQCDQDRSSFELWWPSESTLLCHNKINWVNSVWMQDFWVLLRIGQHFMTKDTAEFSQFHAMTCREYTLPREEEVSQPKGWIQGNTKIGPVLEIATIYLHGKHGDEIRIMSLNRDNTHSWVRIPVDQISLWCIWTTMKQKFQKISSKNMR